MWAEDIYIFRPFAFCGFECLFQFSRSGRMVFVVTTSKFFWKVFVDLLEKDCVGFAKEAAYSFILSFFPMLIFVVALFALLGRDSKTEVLQTLQQILPSSSFLLISEYVNQLFQTQPAGLLSVSFVAMVLPATGLVATLAKALDRIYCVPQRRSFWSEQLTCIALVFIIGVPLLSATIAGIIGAYLERSAFSWLKLALFPRLLLSLGRWSVIFLTVFLIIVALYRIAPSRRIRWRHILPGAVLATLLWMISTYGFGLYVANFGSYNKVYGGLGAGIVLLVWMYVTSLVFLVGAVFNRQYEVFLSEKAQVGAPPSPFEDASPPSSTG